MSKNEKIQMPSSQGGLVRYFDEEKSKIMVKPGTVVVMVVIVVILGILLKIVKG